MDKKTGPCETENRQITPLKKIIIPEYPSHELFLKIEGTAPGHSVKDRAAVYVIDRILQEKTIDQSGTVIESSSGNLGIALAKYCHQKSLRFICVIDEKILPKNEELIASFGAEIIKIREADKYGGFLVNRLKKVHEIITEHPGFYWINQYGNELVRQAYCSLADEIIGQQSRIDHVFVAVSSASTIAGLSSRFRQLLPAVKIIAVDIKGSVIFGGPPENRSIPGIGSSIVPKNLQHAFIDDVIITDEKSSIAGCRYLYEKFGICAGASSGSVFSAFTSYMDKNPSVKKTSSLLVLPDHGENYRQLVYDINRFF